MSSKLKMFVNTPELWNSFVEEVDQRINACHTKLTQLTEPSDLYRAQGEVQALMSMKKLREKVNG